MKHRKIICTRCKGSCENFRMMELSQTDGNFYIFIPDGHISQGHFPFHGLCFQNQLFDTRLHLINEGIEILPDELNPFAETLLDEIHEIPKKDE